MKLVRSVQLAAVFASAVACKVGGDAGGGLAGAQPCAAPGCADGDQCRDASPCSAGTPGAPTDAGATSGGAGDANGHGEAGVIVDCGASKCAVGQRCNVSADCASNACSWRKVCIERPSCVAHYGGDTCGPGEPDDSSNTNESCCTALPLPAPTGAVMMDRYQVTAGRMRVFLDAVKGDVRAFVKARRPVGWDPLWDDFVPNGWDVDPAIPAESDPEFLRRAHSSVWHQLGGSALLTRLGRDGLPFRYGCNLDGNGVHTYRMPDAVQVDVLHDIPHRYPQEVLDAKALNCATALMLMAFCEWDWPGSRLPIYAETRWAWHGGDLEGHKFPWGNTPAPLGYLYPGDVFGPASGAPEPTGKYGAYAVVPVNAAGTPGSPEYTNWKGSYEYPRVPLPSTRYPDYSAYVAAPGRFPKGNGPFGHADLAGNLFDLTSTIAGEPGQHPDDRELTWGRNGAWEGHEIPFAGESYPWTAPIMRKYGKAGGRCVRPM